MEKTSNFNLNQWAATDPIRREDFNADNAAIDAAIKAAADAASGARTTANSAVNTANAAYSATNPPYTIAQVSTTGKVSGDTVYTFTKTPKFIFIRGVYVTGLMRSGDSLTLLDFYHDYSGYEVTFKLSGTKLTMTSREDTDAFATLTIAAFY